MGSFLPPSKHPSPCWSSLIYFYFTRSDNLFKAAIIHLGHTVVSKFYPSLASFCEDLCAFSLGSLKHNATSFWSWLKSSPSNWSHMLIKKQNWVKKHCQAPYLFTSEMNKSRLINQLGLSSIPFGHFKTHMATFSNCKGICRVILLQGQTPTYQPQWPLVDQDATSILMHHIRFDLPPVVLLPHLQRSCPTKRDGDWKQRWRKLYSQHVAAEPKWTGYF